MPLPKFRKSWQLGLLGAIATLGLVFWFNAGLPPSGIASAVPAGTLCGTGADPAAACWTMAQANSATSSPATPAFETQALQEYVQTAGRHNLSAIFTIFFLTIGPLKIVPAFAKMTANADRRLRTQLALRSTLIATLTILLTALFGVGFLNKYGIPVTALTLAAGVLLFLVALKMVLSQYEPAAAPSAPPAPPSLKLVVTPLTFPTILTPYGIAIVIIVMALSRQLSGNANIVIGLLMLIMVLNLLAMLFADGILKVLRPAILNVIGLVLGIIQLSLALAWMIAAIRVEALVIHQLISL